MDIKTGKTPDGQGYISFQTKYNEKCTLVAGVKLLRCAIRDQDDVSMHAPYTHFTREQVQALLPYLQSFADTGDFGIERIARTMKWIKAQNIQEGDTILISTYEVKVTSVDALVGTDSMTITAGTGQKHALKTWQDVQVVEEQEGH